MEPIIDLDRFADLDETYDMSGTVSWSWPEIRAVALAGTLVLALLIGGAGIPGANPFPGTTVRVGINSGFQLTGGALYVVGRGSDSVTAYSLDGERRWTANVQPSRPEAIVGAGERVLVGETGTDRGSAVALDTQTGRRSWRRPGRPLTVNPERNLATVAVEQPDVGQGAMLDPPTTVVGVDLRSGRPLWSYDISVQIQVNVAQIVQLQSPRVLTVTGVVLFDTSQVRLRVRMLDLVTGKISSAPTVPVALAQSFVVDLGAVLVGVVPLNPTGEGAGGGGTGGGDSGAAGDQWRVTAYDPGTLRPRWERILPAGQFAFAMCGRWICASSAGHLQALDPVTGVDWWQGPWTYAVGGPTRALAVAEGDGVRRTGVIDPATGGTLLALPGWQPVRYAEARWVPLVRSLDDAERSEVAVLDLQELRAYRIGDFQGGPAQCQADEEYLACSSGLERIAVWRYQPDQSAEPFA